MPQAATFASEYLGCRSTGAFLQAECDGSSITSCQSCSLRQHYTSPKYKSRHFYHSVLKLDFVTWFLFLAILIQFGNNLVTAADKHGTATVDRRYELQILRRLLAAGYTYYARPLTTDNGTLEVRTRISLIKIQNLWERTDVKTEALEVTMRIQLNWCDGALSWEPESFGGVDYVIIPGDRLWIPDIQIINALDDVYALIRDRRFDFKLHSDGCVWWFPTGTIFTRCELDLSYFPFDIQRCPIVFESAMYPKEFLNLTVRYDKSAVSLKTFTESGQWDLMTAYAIPKLNYVTSSTAFSRVEITLEIRRKTLYYKINVFFPCGMLSALQILTFFLPIGSEDRISQSTTILLSVVVFQSIVVGELPRTSNSIPLLCVYIDFLTGISVITVADAILGVYVLNNTNRHGCLAKIFKILSFFEKSKPTGTQKNTNRAAIKPQRRKARRENHFDEDNGDLELLPYNTSLLPDRFVVGSGSLAGTPATVLQGEGDAFEEDSLDAVSRHGILSSAEVTTGTNLDLMVLSSNEKSSGSNYTLTMLNQNPPQPVPPNYGAATAPPTVQVPLKNQANAARRQKSRQREDREKQSSSGDRHRRPRHRSADKEMRPPKSTKHKCYDPLYVRPTVYETYDSGTDFEAEMDELNNRSTLAGQHQRASSALRTAAVCIDNVVFLIALTSSIMIPFYMFNVLPPTS